jgi:hypothetical protein
MRQSAASSSTRTPPRNWNAWLELVPTTRTGSVCQSTMSVRWTDALRLQVRRGRVSMADSVLVSLRGSAAARPRELRVRQIRDRDRQPQLGGADMAVRNWSARLRLACCRMTALQTSLARFAPPLAIRTTGTKSIQKAVPVHLPSFVAAARGLPENWRAAGNQPASLEDVSRYIIGAYDTRSGGGGNCTRVPRSVDDGLYVRSRSFDCRPRGPDRQGPLRLIPS